MLEYLEELLRLDGTSGSEKPVRDFIISAIDGFCEYKIDPLGNILVNKKGKAASKNKIMFDAHMDEVGFIITAIDRNGFLRFKTVGGIDTSVMLSRRVKINGNVNGVTGGKPKHLLSSEQAEKLPDSDSLYIDIGAESKTQAENFVQPGDTGVICGDITVSGDKIISKALDDRVGCAVLIDLIRADAPFDFCASFSVAEEIGCRGARVAAYTLSPDVAFVLEGTTAADIAGTPNEKTVCETGGGVAVSFMDGGTVYDRALFDIATKSGKRVQLKKGTSGGNDSASIHLSKGGVKTLALSVPCRYIHSNASVCDKNDIIAMEELAIYLLSEAAQKEL